jgi:drug/metabolite transporter (DMT)-like permease
MLQIESMASAPSAKPRFDPRVLLAFFAIYILWGTTFLAIRIAVHEMPPLLAAGSRFFIAGLLLFGVMRLGLPGIARQPNPTKAEWRNLTLVGLILFVANYAPLFWAERYIPSGIASVLSATIPIFAVLLEMVVLRHQPFRWIVLLSALLGFAGVAVILLPTASQHPPLIPCLAVLTGCVAWSSGTVLSRAIPLPASRPVTSGATMMLGGAALLILSAAIGELHPLPHISTRGYLAVLYLITAGSLIGFTAYVWLLGHMSATRVTSYAYINPLVAVALGSTLAHEPINLRMLLGAAIVLVSVFLILQTNKPGPSPATAISNE